MTWIEQPDGSKVSTPFWSGYGEIPKGCPDGNHEWEVMTQALYPTAAVCTERCTKCGWQRDRQIPFRSSEDTNNKEQDS